MREAKRGETSGRKDRPVAVAVRRKVQHSEIVLLLAITSQPPQANQIAVEITDAEKRRVGLDDRLRLWIVLSEYNYDIIGRSYYLEPQALIGRFSHAFFEPVFARFASQIRLSPGVDRTT